MSHKANLDILRALAVTFVILDHLALTLHAHFGVLRPSLLEIPKALGHVGVLAFFVHTSLVLMFSLARMKRAEKGVIGKFYARRIFRIYPLAVFAILLSLMFRLPAAPWLARVQPTHAVIAANLLLVQNLFTKKEILSPLWSLPYEVQMYVFLPALFLVASLRRATLYLVLAFAASCGLGTAIALTTGHLNMAAYLPCFLCGVLSYSWARSAVRKVSSSLWVPYLLLLTGSFVLANARGLDGTMYWTGWIFCFLLGLGINHFRDCRVGFVNYTAERIATYSYGIYLLHILAFYLSFSVFHLRSAVSASCVALGLTGVMAIAAYRLVEAPLIRLGKSLTSARRRNSAVAIAPPEDIARYQPSQDAEAA